MLRKVITYITYPMLMAGLVLGLVGVAYAANINSTNKWAWGTNVGWLNFDPAHGGGVTVYSDHLEGYVWGENIGWIRLGTTGSGDPYYDNTTADNYGVNNDGSGNLFGYAWGTNVGWINFDPTHGDGVTIDGDGKFDGYAWGENVGWIHFQNSSPEYYVQTDWAPTVVTLARFVARSAGRDLTGFGNLSGCAGGNGCGCGDAAAVGATQAQTLRVSETLRVSAYDGLFASEVALRRGSWGQ